MGADWDFLLADAILGINADLNWNITASMKPNVYATVEGSSERYDAISGFNIASNQFRDVNGDGFVDVDIKVDPILGYNISASVGGGLDSSFEALGFDLSIPIWGVDDVEVGPLVGPFELNLGRVQKNLFEDSGVVLLSDVFDDILGVTSTKVQIPVT